VLSPRRYSATRIQQQCTPRVVSECRLTDGPADGDAAAATKNAGHTPRCGEPIPFFVAARAERVGSDERPRSSLPTAPPMAMTPPLRRVLPFRHGSASRPWPFLRSGARQARRSGGRQRASLPPAPPMATPAFRIQRHAGEGGHTIQSHPGAGRDPGPEREHPPAFPSLDPGLRRDDIEGKRRAGIGRRSADPSRDIVDANAW